MTDYVVSGGQVSSGINLMPSEMLTVLSGGTASAMFLRVGSIETISSGGLDIGTTAVGTQIVEAGGTASGVELTLDGDGGAGVQEVFGTAISSVVQLGAIVVESGGSTTATRVNTGSENVLAGGVSFSASIGLATQVVYGRAVDATIEGFQSVSSGGVVVSTTVGGTQTIYAGGTASATVDGGLQEIDSGGVAIGVIVNGQGSETVSGGTVAGVVVNSGGTQVFSGGGLAGTETVSSGGTTVNPAIAGSALLDLQVGAVVSGSVSFTGVLATLEIEGTASPAYTISGFTPGDNTIDLPNLAFAGNASATLGTGNVLHVREGGARINLQLDSNQNYSGDTFTLSPDASGGTLVGVPAMIDYVVSGGQVSSGIILNPSDTLTVLSGGTATSTSIADGALETVSSGGVDLGADSIGTQIIAAGGLTSGSVLEFNPEGAGGVQDIFGTALDTLVRGNAVVVVENGGSATGTTVSDFGGEEITAGGLSLSSVISPTATQDVNGSAVDATILGGVQIVHSGGFSFDAAVIDGTEIISSGGAAALTSVADGSQEIDAGGTASGVVVDDLGIQTLSGGTVAGVVVSSGGVQVISSGGIVGAEAVSAGGTTVDPAIQALGLLDLQVGAVVSGGVTFAAPAGGWLEIEGAASPAYTISAFAPGDTVDLPNLPFAGSGGATLGAANLLQVTGSGGSSIDLQFDPSQSFSGETFRLAPDAGSGTLVGEVPQALRDFDGNGTSDVLWRGTDGNVAIWEMNGLSVAASGLAGFADPTSWQIQGTGDFNGDGEADILWRNNNGSAAIWDMNGLTVVSSGLAGVADPTSWSIAATGDFNGDGTSDILWRATDGNVAIWEMSGGTLAQVGLAFADPTAWSIKGTGDFNGDGKSDILWQNTNGSLDLWEMNGTSIAASGAVVGATAAPGWTIRGTGDFNGDGMSDILWQNQSGDVAIWEMDGFSVAASAVVGFADPTAWHVAGIGDYNGDGKSDILWQDTSGDVGVWEMDGFSVAASGLVGFAASASWHIVPPDNSGSIPGTG
jgi:autotransporter passenger strand-loop-strand repeat protein